jgi:ribonucrease Y
VFIIDVILYVIIGVIALIIGVAIGVVLKNASIKKLTEAERTNFEKEKVALEEEFKKKEKQLEIERKEAAITERSKIEQEFKYLREDLRKLELKLAKKEVVLQSNEEKFEQREKDLHKKEKEVIKTEKEVKELKAAELTELQKISGLTTSEAKKMLIDNMMNEAKFEASKLIKKIEDDARKEAERKAKRLITLTVQRLANEFVAETTISTVELPSDEMKGRIIGREGRNIKEFEKCAGVDLIIDDTPEIVTISCYDPYRREISKLALEKLIVDGRIHPTRIEEVINKTIAELDKVIYETGEQVIMDLGIHNIHEDIYTLLGKLKYRTSFGQNVLQHSIEVARIASIMAAELGANPKVAKRMGLLHDIGKAIDSSVEGTHAQIGSDIALKYGEKPFIAHAIAAHHGDVEFKSIEGVLVATADAISAARPGARKENVETYIKRLEELESIAKSFEGVEKSYAIQAGRELRVIIRSEKVSDEQSEIMARDIATKIEKQLEYPGVIKIVVVRETRIIEYAK